MKERCTGIPSTGISGAEGLQPIVVITAMPMEARAILRHLSGVRVLVSGVGHENACRAAMAAQPRPGLLISAGICGGLTPELQVGDLVVEGTAAALIPPRWQRGPIACVETPVQSPAARRKLAGDTGAVAVDMESRGVAGAAEKLGVPFLAVKAVCDTLDAELPEEIAALLDPRGRIPILSLSLRLIARPSLIPRLWRLRKDCNRALQQLGLGVRQIIEDIRP